MGSSITPIDETARLKRAVEELSILNDLARSIGASLNSEEIMQTIVRRSIRALNAEQGVITLVDARNVEPMKTLVRAVVSSADQGQFHLHQALIGWMHLNLKPLMVEDTQRDERFQGVSWDVSVRSLLCVPLMVKSELRGVLTLYNKKEGLKFTTDDQRLLAIIAAQSAQVIENARLYEEEKQFLKMQQEVRLAATIQMDLLPKVSPSVPGYEIFGTSIPAQTVGGDYFDFIPMSEGRIALCLGDVTGKGLPASLLMANLQATLRGQTLVAVHPNECLNRSNKLLYQSTSPEKFATVFYAILDPRTHTLSYSNAGHDNPFIFAPDGSSRRLTAGGIMLGAFEEFTYEEDSANLQPGEVLVVYSDGFTEAMNAMQEMYTEKTLQTFLHAHRQESPRAIAEELIVDVQKHAAGFLQSDDMTVVIVRRVA